MNYIITPLILTALLLVGCTNNNMLENEVASTTLLEPTSIIDTNLDASDTLPSDVLAALDQALDDEYKAYSTYEQVMEEFGSVPPFSNIINAEDNHVDALIKIYEEYGIDIPKNEYTDTPLLNGISSLADACSVGVQAEIDNAALYENDLLPAVSDYPSITGTFTRLMNASQNNHLPAFQRCSN